MLEQIKHIQIMGNKLIKSNFLVVSDYNWLPGNIEESWVHELTDNYVILDKFHRPEWEDKSDVIKQKNVGQNIYDMFDFIVENYDNLPDVTIFCRSCIFFPKGRKPPLSNGNCNLELFKEVCNNTTLTELHDFGPEVHNGIGSKLGPNGSYLEVNNSWYFNHIKSKYFRNTNTFLNEVYVNPEIPSWIRFAPGCNYIVPKENILKYNKEFYEYIRHLLSWDVVVGEAHMIERCIYTFFNTNWEINEKYVNN
mgnify:FL=1